MPIASNSFASKKGKLDWAANIKKIFKWSKDGQDGWQLANWLLYIKKYDLKVKATLGQGEKWTLEDLRRRTLLEPDHCPHSIKQWVTTSTETEVEEIARVNRLL